WTLFLLVVGLFLIVSITDSIHRIGPTEVGLVTKRFSWKKLAKDNPVAFDGEAGYQAELLMPGLRWKSWLIYSVQKYPWVQVPAGQIGVVIAQVGAPLPIGAKSAVYKKEFANFSDLRSFVQNGGQKGVQRPVLPPGTLVPVHPVAFLIITRSQVYGLPVSPEIREKIGRGKVLSPEALGLDPSQLELVRIEPQPQGKDGRFDVVGIVTTYEGDPLPSGDIASRLGGFADMAVMEKGSSTDQEIIETLLGSKNNLHNNYQDFQAFLDRGGKIGLQHDSLLYGAYALNPFLVSVELVPMMVVKQGEVAVIKAYVGLVTEDTSGKEFKFGSLVRPGHRGVWQEPLRTGKYPLNPRCYEAEIVPTAILNLNWADAVSEAHTLDKQLQQIIAKSSEGFVFKIDLQVQIHVPDTNAPRVISMVGTMRNLVSEVLQAAVGNHFRDNLQSMPAVRFIETRKVVQEQAFTHIKEQLEQYQVETKGVYIQDVVFPADLVTVLTHREIANQEIETFKKQRAAEDERIEMEQAKGTADMQADLARSKVGISIKKNNADARVAEGGGEAEFIRQTGTAKGAEVEAVGLARAKGFQAQVNALGPNATALVNIITALSEGKAKFVPDILVTSSGNGGGALDGLAATAMRFLAGSTASAEPATPADKISAKAKGKDASPVPGSS
ncbi:MAG TPA: SPFH domain-containing protein, partial [Candidatus Acidoferrales bacterium]|nr:SPFH domain-containing protein [Candidatus Acidoferrales bacterium]